ncbi:hypothetical protein BP00DRAFT_57166 [Aspergillus indologenus CBS 114.80]|uniref:Uncharacterized protein n=1 Tax=Aspergillus indologenus CBS 114.80 TaxID=1450541 RepID=A0A2V5IH84_9EURO|nr:hypothetical protein BP00DRAFT_57166 [Aspergillus indologenus CBS 114.80]
MHISQSRPPTASTLTAISPHSPTAAERIRTIPIYLLILSANVDCLTRASNQLHSVHSLVPCHWPWSSSPSIVTEKREETKILLQGKTGTTYSNHVACEPAYLRRMSVCAEAAGMRCCFLPRGTLGGGEGRRGARKKINIAPRCSPSQEKNRNWNPKSKNDAG